MNGVEILSECAVYTTQTWVAWVGVLAFIGAFIFAIITFTSRDLSVALWINLACFIVCFVTFSSLALVDKYTNHLKQYSHTELKVTIDDSVSMNEFLDKYEILYQEGKIYTVKERK